MSHSNCRRCNRSIETAIVLRGILCLPCLELEEARFEFDAEPPTERVVMIPIRFDAAL